MMSEQLNIDASQSRLVFGGGVALLTVTFLWMNSHPEGARTWHWYLVPTGSVGAILVAMGAWHLPAKTRKLIAKAVVAGWVFVILILFGRSYQPSLLPETLRLIGPVTIYSVQQSIITSLLLVSFVVGGIELLLDLEDRLLNNPEERVDVDDNW